MATQFVQLPDGAKLAYEVLGSEYLGSKQPVVLVVGLSNTRSDFERLYTALAKSRPVLLFDHRGIGDSTYSTEDKDDVLTIESMARDFHFLLESLKWSSVSICAYSMGGIITLQLLFLPFHPTNPKPLPWKVTHVFLTATMTSPLNDKRYGVRLSPLPTDKVLTPEVLKDFIKPQMERMFDSKWISDPSTKDRQEWWLNQMLLKRPYRTILKQAKAATRFSFSGLHANLSDINFLIIHGTADQIVPYYCGEEIQRLMPWAKFVETGDKLGQVPSNDYGHNWFEYFDIGVWTGVIESFLASGGQWKARL